jgi:hypothetical protein
MTSFEANAMQAIKLEHLHVMITCREGSTKTECADIHWGCHVTEPSENVIRDIGTVHSRSIKWKTNIYIAPEVTTNCMQFTRADSSYLLLTLLFCFWYSFLLRVESTPGPSAAGRIRYIEKN